LGGIFIRFFPLVIILEFSLSLDVENERES